tara:strand:- start:274 stop:1038 length:765 start_codon:yes stop_codon:yes gene_type:complete
MQIVCLIPSRIKSERLKEKQIANIAGIPMFAHSYFRALLSNIGEVYVCTDSQKIIDYSIKLNIKSLLTKTSHNNGTERVSEGAEKLNLKQNDVIVNLHGDEPFIDPKDLKKMLNYFLDNNEIDVLIPYVLTKEKINNLNNVKIITNQSERVLYLSRSRIPSNFKKNQEIQKQCGVSIYRYGFLKKYLKLGQSKNEIMENIEIMRAVDNGFYVGGFKLNNYFYSVDIKNDLIKANRDMKKDKVFKKYQNTYKDLE